MNQQHLLSFRDRLIIFAFRQRLTIFDLFMLAAGVITLEMGAWWIAALISMGWILIGERMEAVEASLIYDRGPAKNAQQVMQLIEELRAEEADVVLISCDNPEADSTFETMCVECQGFWTDFITFRFYGPNVYCALALAAHARRTNDHSNARKMGIAITGGHSGKCSD